jgi:DNA-binding NarL/FixJ family response regulator
VLFADDQFMVAEALRSLPEFDVVGVVEDGRALVVAALTLRPDVIVEDIVMRALEAGAAGYALEHSASVTLFTAIRSALEGNAYLATQLAGEVLESMKRGTEQAGCASGSVTPRQREVLQLLAEGRSAKQIAAALSISTRTVECHKRQMMERLGLHSSGELVHFAMKHGLVEI